MMLTYNVVLNVCDEYCKLGDVIAMETLKRFCKSMQTMVSQGCLLVEKIVPNVLAISIQ
jgi:hypothetical protein